MFRYIIIESMEPIKQHEATLISFFSDIMHIDDIEQQTHRMIFYYRNESNLAFEELIINLSTDTLVSFRLFESHHFKTTIERDKNLAVMTTLLKRTAIAKDPYLNEVSLLQRCIHQLDKMYISCFLKAYANDFMMLHTVRIYLESNQNMSYAAKKLFIHRNTLIQRIDKFIDVTGFNIKKFVPGYLIYSLLTAM